MTRSLLPIALLAAVACGDNAGDVAPIDSSLPLPIDAAVDAVPLPPSELGGDRPVTVEGPARLEPGRTYPLVLVLHGHGATGFTQAAYLQIAPLVDNPGIILMAPDGTPGRDGRRFWNGSPACCDDGRNIDDVAYLGGLLDDAIATWPVDRSRVFVVGHSNGDFMANRLACERADVVTAIVGLAGAAISTDGSGCTPAKPVSVLHIHGTLDETIGYEGGSIGGDAYPGAEETVRQWSVHNGCTGARADAAPIDLDTSLTGNETEVSAYAGCPATGAVELWTIVDGRHLPSLGAGFGTRVMTWLQAHARP